MTKIDRINDRDKIPEYSKPVLFFLNVVYWTAGVVWRSIVFIPYCIGELKNKIKK